MLVQLAKQDNKNKRKTPNIVYTRRHIQKIKNKIEKAKSLMKWDNTKKLKNSLASFAEEIKSHKMSPSQYVKISEENLRILNCKAEVQRAAAEAKGIKIKFKDKPSIKIIKKDNNVKKAPLYDQTPQQPIESTALKKLIEDHIKTAPSWKASGIDKIPLGIYKILPTAKNLLIYFIHISLLEKHHCKMKNAEQE